MLYERSLTTMFRTAMLYVAYALATVAELEIRILYTRCHLSRRSTLRFEIKPLHIWVARLMVRFSRPKKMRVYGTHACCTYVQGYFVRPAQLPPPSAWNARSIKRTNSRGSLRSLGRYPGPMSTLIQPKQGSMTHSL